MADLVRRSDVLALAKDVTLKNGAKHRCIDATLVHEIPSAEPERKIGRWREVYAETDYRNGWIEFTCECCEYQHGLESGEYGWHYGDEIPWKFCPVCGAEMKGENDG